MCYKKSEYQNFLNEEEKGENIDYECTALTNGSISSAVIDTRTPMIVGTDEVPVDEISFAKELEVSDITKATSYSVVLNEASVTYDSKKLILKGYATPIVEAREGLKLNRGYNMDFYDTSSDKVKNVHCTLTELREGVGNGLPCTLECNTESNQITTNYGNLTLAKINENNLYLTVNPDLDGHKPEDIISPYSSSGRNTFHKKSSVGLSGRTIAGIVIACVIVLAAVSIAAIMLRKPAPHYDQNTSVELKIAENMYKGN